MTNAIARETAAKSGRKEAELTASDEPSMRKFLPHHVAQHVNASRAAIEESHDLGDAITVDLSTRRTREFNKDLRLLEAHLTRRKAGAKNTLRRESQIVLP